ncbi:MAG: KpsF/GutQ family sugar-phosphate isomerase [Caldimicrobium sp.]|nr:KpsF/GutQ family sugar-phosphate isomerase [Caldimicrobium sp.]MCX7873091.1 KpsF/GutQ family sugar-phosphate isomerase [Caldimicrobium sp.]MDW8094516.1 KpsF/GutQ family sugar-phosphate isomerase [Caldimicrobium sp.]
MFSFDILNRAKEIISIEKEGLEALLQNLDVSFEEAIKAIYNISGRVVVTGVGKSGLIGRKISATLSSTGTPSFFLHPVEALHGDLGMVTSNDLLLALSYSGNTLEVCEVAKILRKRNIPVVSMTGNPKSVLGEISNIVLNVAVPREACSFGLAPTTSTTAMLALGDAIAITLFELRGLSQEDFRRNHPGGTLGERLKVRVKEIMLKGDSIPIVKEGVSLKEALEELDKKRLGAVLIVDSFDHLVGIFTDGDLRRVVRKFQALPEINIEEVMTKNPKKIEENRLAVEALEIMEKHQITVLPVINFDDQLVGILHLHDILGKGTFKFVL